jgi:hypothetical protein
MELSVITNNLCKTLNNPRSKVEATVTQAPKLPLCWGQRLQTDAAHANNRYGTTKD